MNHKHLLAGVAVSALMTAGTAFAASHTGSTESQLQAQAAMIDALSKEVEALKADAVERTGVRPGVKGVNLSISGQVNRAVFFGSDALDNSFFNFVDNDASSTRVRWDADAPVSDATEVGARLEVELESNSSLFVGAPGSTAAADADNDLFGVRQAYVFVEGGFGTLSTGHQSEATDGVLHNSFNYATLADINPEFTAGALGLAGAFLPSFGDGGRDDQIMYATPSIAGFKAAASVEDDGQLTAQGNYSGEIAGIGLLAGIGYNAEQGAADDNLAGSFGINFGPIALNGAAATNLSDDASGSDAFYYYFNLAHRGNYVDLGPTSVSIDFGNSNGVIDGGGDGYAIGGGLVQGVAPGADAYVSFRHYNTRNADSAQAVLAGMRVTF